MNITTNRLLINELTYQDSSFLIQLLNQPSFKQYIGERYVTDVKSAEKFLDNGYFLIYPKQLGMYCVRDKITNEPLGVCGIMKRDFLPIPDLGYAFLDRYQGQGYAFEAAWAIIEKVKKEEKYAQIGAMTSIVNDASIGLLTKLNFTELTEKTNIKELNDCRYFELNLT